MRANQLTPSFGLQGLPPCRWPTHRRELPEKAPVRPAAPCHQPANPKIVQDSSTDHPPSPVAKHKKPNGKALRALHDAYLEAAELGDVASTATFLTTRRGKATGMQQSCTGKPNKH